MTTQLLLTIIAGGVLILATISLINFLQKLGFNIYHKIRIALNPQMKAHKRELKRQRKEAKGLALAEKYKQK